MFEKISNLDQALSTYHVAIGTPVASMTQVLDSNHVYTWYKLRILETGGSLDSLRTFAEAKAAERLQHN